MTNLWLKKLSSSQKVLWVGIGCQRHTPKPVIETAIKQVFQEHQLAEDAIIGIATIDGKADEPGLVELCSDRHWILQTFSPQQLQGVKVPNPSMVVQQKTATPSVAEAAALQAAGVSTLLIPKCIYRVENLTPEGAKISQAVTIAIAKSTFIDSREKIGNRTD
ncbi:MULTISPECIES: cobalamin biosynthesis protein [Arthrospira]|jgi:cobalt-precorrin 5A hydrolase/precorrin-3B C17-methyltransferase|uniref:CobE/GbiG C-terminal domain-containing protein n=1 Tax=Limnospira platensis NIES-46 TaxID=1236695 RepID=A0A5M3TE32_LIMPL|nr:MULTISPECIES: cobalamin biosynthesis protein [Arthrospira]AMW28707.1 cobalamin biosynthesis protein CbiG [Arthrospira platensis YZ]KDR56203.1 cobalamin biosynthesis protein CbiG [Arthrospira platensis str. Paraca]MBD2670402.1 cobalamin biosynthesis protein [Arthrospira platensis FACHB-439]MBD2713261.1 cobalamin biosynthesis protein [Arthrospira platensis FACHB-835]MDF2210441.1 cobalamin biosynthesis protein [Arthrospira platensis NCB002]MDT9183544.1 cobalamin biosynthesis protein [Limnospi